MAVHLKIGGSTAARTLACPGWIKSSIGIKPRPAGMAAIEGSMHHEVQEMCQKTFTEPKDHLGFVYTEGEYSLEFTEEHLDLSGIAYNATNALLDELDIDTMMVEPFLQIVPGEAGGSIDLLGLSADGKTLLVLDYKFGGHRVAAKELPQGLFYALCVETDPETKDMMAKVERIVIAIVQPKIKGTVDTWSCSRKQLDAFNSKVLKAMDEAFSDKPQVFAGDHCKWCPAEPYCDTKRVATFAATLLDPHSHNELCAAAAEVDRVENWIKAVKEEMYLQMSRGVSVPGWKIVDKRANRKWVSEEAVRAHLKNRGFAASDIQLFEKTALLTPAQAEKVQKKYDFDIDLDQFTVKESSGTTLAHEDDSREAVVVTDVAPQLAELVKSKN